MIKSIKYIAVFSFFLVGCGENTPKEPEGKEVVKIDSVAEEREPAKEHKVYPVDEAKLDESLLKARKDLLKACETKDVDLLLQYIDPEIKWSFGDDVGMEGFKEYWELNTHGAESELWFELGEVLRLGGAFNNKDRSIFTAPYVFTNFPEDYELYEHGLITGAGVHMRTAPNLNANIIKDLDCDVVLLDYEEEDKVVYENIGGQNYPWQKIITFDGTEGYVYGRFVRDPIDYRAAFEKQESGWKIFVFVSGD